MFTYHDRRELKRPPFAETIRWHCPYRDSKKGIKRQRVTSKFMCNGTANVSIVPDKTVAQLVVSHIDHSHFGGPRQSPKKRPDTDMDLDLEAEESGDDLEDADEGARPEDTAYIEALLDPTQADKDPKELAKQAIEYAIRDVNRKRKAYVPTLRPSHLVAGSSVPPPSEGSRASSLAPPAARGYVSSDHEGELELEVDDDDEDYDYRQDEYPQYDDQQGSDLDSHVHTPSSKRGRTSSTEPSLLAALANEASRAVPIPTPPRPFDAPTPFGEQTGPDPEEQAIEEAERTMNDALELLKRCRSARVNNGRAGGGMPPTRERAWRAALLQCGVARDSIAALGAMR